MTIETHKDPKTRKDYMLAVGKVDGLYINPLKEVKTYSGPNGPWSPTHSVNLVVDGTRISLGLTDKETVRAKDTNDEYQDVAKGAEVSVVITENGEYKGVKQYQSRASQITVLEVAPEGSQSSAQALKQPYTPSKKDMSGMIAGNGFNAAKALLTGEETSIEDFIATAKQLINIGQDIREKTAKANPDLSDYDVGARSGMALIAACEWVESINDVESTALEILNEYLPEITEYAKSLGGEEKKPVVKKTIAKKSVVKKTSKHEVSSERIDDQDIPSSVYNVVNLEEDDSIPF